MHYYQDTNEAAFEGYTYPYTTAQYNSSSKQDVLTIHGQLIAGHQLTQTKADTDNKASSKNDQLVMYGAFYSFVPPILSYFDRTDYLYPNQESTARLYLFDQTLAQVPLGGSPYFPLIAGNYTTTSLYVPGIDIAQIVPGTWKVISGN